LRKTVYRTWKKPFDQISNDLRQRIEHCNIVNKGWDSVYYDDEQMHRFFRETRKDLNPLYNTLPEMVEKADLFRYAVIHTFGGVYLDSDIHCNLPFDDMFNVTRFLEESAKMREKERLEKEEEEKKQAEAASTAASPPEGWEKSLSFFIFVELLNYGYCRIRGGTAEGKGGTRERAKEGHSIVCLLHQQNPPQVLGSRNPSLLSWTQPHW